MISWFISRVPRNKAFSVIGVEEGNDSRVISTEAWSSVPRSETEAVSRLSRQHVSKLQTKTRSYAVHLLSNIR